jgi:hypothetical protein
MTWAITALVVTGVSTALNAYGQIEAGKAQEEAAEREAELQKMEAQTEELKRRQELNRRLAAQNVAMAAEGIGTEGSLASIALKSAEQIGTSEQVIGLSEGLRRRQLRQQGKVAASMGKIGAATSLLGGGAEMAKQAQNL